MSSSTSVQTLKGKKKTGRKKDQFWKYADNLKGKFKCKFCKHEFFGGATRIKSHLSRKTGRGIAICADVTLDVEEAARKTIDEHARKQAEKYRKHRTKEDIENYLLHDIDLPRD